MPYLPRSAQAWGHADFEVVLKQELAHLGLAGLPLQQGLSSSSVALDDKLQVVLLSIQDDADRILVKAALFYTGIIAGCSCADDPSPVEAQAEHCEVAVEIHKSTGATNIKLL